LGYPAVIVLDKQGMMQVLMETLSIIKVVMHQH